MHVYIYKMNILVDLMYLIIHEVIIFLNEPERLIERCHPSLHLLRQSQQLLNRCSFISRPDLFCDGKYIVTSTHKTNVERVFKCFLWLFKLFHDTF